MLNYCSLYYYNVCFQVVCSSVLNLSDLLDVVKFTFYKIENNIYFIPLREVVIFNKQKHIYIQTCLYECIEFFFPYCFSKICIKYKEGKLSSYI